MRTDRVSRQSSIIEDIEKFRSRIRQGVTPADTVCSLRDKDIQHILQKEFAAYYSLGGTYFLLHRLGFSLDPYVSMRSVYYQYRENLVQQ